MSHTLFHLKHAVHLHCCLNFKKNPIEGKHVLCGINDATTAGQFLWNKKKILHNNYWNDHSFKHVIRIHIFKIDFQIYNGKPMSGQV